MEEAQPAALNLDVYDTKRGLWHPDHGELELPSDWEFLPVGDTFVTRQVKAGGRYWIVWRPRGKNRPHRRKLGLFAPAISISSARAQAEQTASQRARQRVVNERHRHKVEHAYQADFAAEVVAWLAFAPEHAALAEEIARAAADRAVEVGSGRVGRTKLLPLEERAALAARATIRHLFTDYDDRLIELNPADAEVADHDYRATKQEAHRAVDDFLYVHREAPDHA